MKKLFYSFLLLSTVLSAQAQETKQQTSFQKILSPADSVLLKRYKKGANESLLYSYEHQLYLDSILMLLPTHAYYWQQKAMPLFKQKKYEIGLAYLDSAVKYDENNHYLEYRAFMKCIFQKTYSAAIVDFEAARKKYGFSFVMDHSYDFYMGLCYLQLDQFNKADSLMQSSVNWAKANHHDPHYLELYYLGIVNMEKKNDSLAIFYLDSALNMYGHYADAKYYKALCLQNIGKTHEAKVMMNEALADFKAGYINNEDNSFYEDYPYQPRKYAYEKTTEYFNKTYE